MFIDGFRRRKSSNIDKSEQLSFTKDVHGISKVL